jgi:UrcA family protein
MNRFATVAALAASFGLLGGASAFAADTNVTIERVSVSHGDLNLSSDAGARALFARIKSAATLACGGRPEILEVAPMERFQACKKTAMASAIIRIGSPKVAALNGETIEQTASAR